MDMISSARRLQELLVIHDRAAQQIEHIDMHTDEISRRLLVNDLRNQHQDVSTLYFRLSVVRGVRTMLEKFRLRSIARVQKLSRDILMYLQAEDTSNPQQTSESYNTFVTMDTAASKYTESVEMTLRGE